MKSVLRVFLFFLATTAIVKAQGSNEYHILISKANLFHLQKDYRNAIECFERGFSLQKPDALHAYKAAGAYSLDSNHSKAFQYLNLALSEKWREADWLAFDPYFDYLRNSYPDKWRKLERKAFLMEREYARTLKIPALRKQINLLTLKDQKLRYQRIQARDKAEINTINQQIKKSDVENLNIAKAIISQYGWPKVSDIGKDGQNNLWLVVQHADNNVLFQQRALDAMDKIKDSSEINLENYAFLYDRIQSNLNYKQLYGTQVNWTSNGKASGFRPILEEHLVDDRRRSIGLLPLEIYSLTYGFHYAKPSVSDAVSKDSADLAYTKQLIDSAKYFYKRGEFKETYDFYNNASAVQGGMTNEENYEAALVFATIFLNNNEPRYKDIAIDFLNLLYQRHGLTKAKLENQPEFKMFYNEKRWLAFFNHLQ